jgi:hypothetical protein
MADPTNPRDSRSMPADPARSGENRAWAKKIEAVSGALMARRSFLDRLPRPAKINLPELARSIGDIARRSPALATPSSKFEVHSISLNPTRVRLPKEGSAAGSMDLEHPQEEEIGLGKPLGDRSIGSIQANTDPATSEGRVIPSASLPMKAAMTNGDPTPAGTQGSTALSLIARIEGSIERISRASDRSDERRVPVNRASPATIIPASREGFQDLKGAGDPQTRPDAGSVVGYADQSNTIRAGEVGRPSGSESVDVSAKVSAVSAVGRLQAGEDVKTTESRKTATILDSLARVIDSGPQIDQQSGSSIHGEPSINFVRSPLSTGLRDFSLSGPAFPIQGGPATDQGGIGKGPSDPASGGTSAPQGGASGELSKTNELLQQLIDAVRKQRGSSLPPGGHSVYPDR